MVSDRTGGHEVIPMFVYNHPPRGNHWTDAVDELGIDNRAYYRLFDDDKRDYMA